MSQQRPTIRQLDKRQYFVRMLRAEETIKQLIEAYRRHRNDEVTAAVFHDAAERYAHLFSEGQS